MDADVVCLQELDKKDYDGRFGKMLGRLSYKGVHAKRASGLSHGFAIFYKARRFVSILLRFKIIPQASNDE